MKILLVDLRSSWGQSDRLSRRDGRISWRLSGPANFLITFFSSSCSFIYLLNCLRNAKHRFTMRCAWQQGVNAINSISCMNCSLHSMLLTVTINFSFLLSWQRAVQNLFVIRFAESYRLSWDPCPSSHPRTVISVDHSESPEGLQKKNIGDWWRKILRRDAFPVTQPTV